MMHVSEGDNECIFRCSIFKMTEQLKRKFLDQLEFWIGTGPKIFTLLYKITRDGCNATTFHQKCDNQGPTVTVLYNPQGSVYGGYGSASWHSTGANIQDGNAFLFQLKFSGSEKFTKFPVVNGAYGLSGHATYGPNFGGGVDFTTFNGTINHTGGVFTLNGQMKIGTYFNNIGLTSDQINNGTKAVTEMEVYRVIDGEMDIIHWRKTPEWNEKFLETLMEDIVAFKPPREMGLSEVRVLMLGPVGSGKSSFYNTVNSVFKGRISQRARSGKAVHSITTVYTPHVTKSRSGAALNFRLCDTRGLEVTQGLNILECNYLLDGHVPDYYEFNPALPISSETHGFVHQPSFSDKIHCVVFVVDSSSIEDIPPKLVEKIISVQEIINHKGIPQVVLLNKIDLACRKVSASVGNVFKSASIQEAVEKVSTMFGLQFNNIFPVKNYVSEMELEADTSILALLALRQILYLTEDYMEGLQEKMKRVKVSAVKFKQSSEKATDKE
ncbi:interferon-induced protein 44-like isoform X2 [Dreissena polymorpha]|nr:interferon-induced protein 44-like isoform X2 [Dreissena polymorpha]XP_052212602.1 interferon-induced protein 44-like isoform X2 [Dreissena polymorpha]